MHVVTIEQLREIARANATAGAVGGSEADRIVEAVEYRGASVIDVVRQAGDA